MRITRQAIHLLIVVVVGFILAVLIFLYEQRHAMPVCRPPNVPIRDLDARLTGVGCATLGPYRAYHGIWVDAVEASWYFPDATAAPPGEISKTDGWLLLDAPDRAKIYAALPPVAEGEKVRDQLVAISFYGTEYRVDEPNKYGLHRFFDIGQIRSVRLVRRDFISDRTRRK